MDLADLYAFLKQQRYGVVSSTGPDGTPQSALVGIAVTPRLEIIFDTLASSRKYRNLTERPVCSFVIGWTGEQTVQLDGYAAIPEPADLSAYQDTYFDFWPDGRAHLVWPGLTYFVVRPGWVRYSDYDQRPPLICEFTF